MPKAFTFPASHDYNRVRSRLWLDQFLEVEKVDDSTSVIKRGNLMDDLAPHENERLFICGGRRQGAKISMHHLLGTRSYWKTAQKRTPKITVCDRSEETPIFISH
jgi:hypothetical protein